ncbi:Tll0287-like domain-containing protein [Marinobacter mobilis]|uniref:Tll0287-like domain-containing protein n=1 Tax=Marinobacter mobilis TaxID=488533 RepID=A0A1H2QBB9_9GAMM|nr:DUF3365 domain-containing protein [Marinobacter mobilis]SDW03719.1 Protein of unknown function [Marinobacter mobilis]
MTLRKSGLAVLVGLSVLAVDVAGGDEAELVAEARSRASAFGADLQATLKSAIQAGGLTQGIEVCKSAAPALADQHSVESWSIGRTALRVRNPGNAPDAWQTEQLKMMSAAPIQDGRPASVWRTRDHEGQPMFEYMQAIPTGEVCLKCHGDNVSEGVQQTLTELYPDDQATGFGLGDLRGAFVIRYWPVADQ